MTRLSANLCGILEAASGLTHIDVNGNLYPLTRWPFPPAHNITQPGANMRYQSRAKKPDTGMELSVTLSLAADETVEQSAESIVKFMEAVQAASASIGAVWVHMRCSGIPAELEDRVQAAIDAAKKPPHLTVVVDNTERD